MTKITKTERQVFDFATTMELASVWEQIVRFQESYAATSNTLVPSPQEQALVRTFLQQVPVPALFACLQDASDRSDSKQVSFILLRKTCVSRSVFRIQLTGDDRRSFAAAGEASVLLYRSRARR